MNNPTLWRSGSTLENIAWNICIACVKIEIDNFCLSGTNNIEEKLKLMQKMSLEIFKVPV